jgi:putative addiction module component (TIGR02574 family)
MVAYLRPPAEPRRYTLKRLMDIQPTVADLASLPVDDRLRIVQALWDSIPPETEVMVSPDQQRELTRRLAAHEADPSSALDREALGRRLKESD